MSVGAFTLRIGLGVVGIEYTLTPTACVQCFDLGVKGLTVFHFGPSMFPLVVLDLGPWGYGKSETQPMLVPMPEPGSQHQVLPKP